MCGRVSGDHPGDIRLGEPARKGAAQDAGRLVAKTTRVGIALAGNDENAALAFFATVREEADKRRARLMTGHAVKIKTAFDVDATAAHTPVPLAFSRRGWR